MLLQMSQGQNVNTSLSLVIKGSSGLLKHSGAKIVDSTTVL